LAVEKYATKEAKPGGCLRPDAWAANKQAVRARRLRRLMRRSWTRRLVNVFLLWHILALSVWLFADDNPSALIQSLLPNVRPYIAWAGLMQSWHMFSPDPTTLDVSVEARITYADGHTIAWPFPRLADMGYGERYQRERFYKFIENAHQDQHRELWPYLARYAARCNRTDPRVPPISVTLIRQFRRIPPPGVPLPPYQTEQFFSTNISPRDLQDGAVFVPVSVLPARYLYQHAS